MASEQVRSLSSTLTRVIATLSLLGATCAPDQEQISEADHDYQLALNAMAEARQYQEWDAVCSLAVKLRESYPRNPEPFVYEIEARRSMGAAATEPALVDGLREAGVLPGHLRLLRGCEGEDWFPAMVELAQRNDDEIVRWRRSLQVWTGVPPRRFESLSEAEEAFAAERESLYRSCPSLGKYFGALSQSMTAGQEVADLLGIARNGLDRSTSTGWLNALVQAIELSGEQCGQWAGTTANSRRQEMDRLLDIPEVLQELDDRDTLLDLLKMGRALRTRQSSEVVMRASRVADALGLETSEGRCAAVIAAAQCRTGDVGRRPNSAECDSIARGDTPREWTGVDSLKRWVNGAARREYPESFDIDDALSSALPMIIQGMNLRTAETKTLSGETLSIGAFKGQRVLLYLWASWCPPCLAEIEQIRRVRGELKRAHVVVVGVSLDSEADGWDSERVAALAQKLGADWLQCWDGLGFEGQLARRVGVTSIPITMIVNEAGTVRLVDTEHVATDNAFVKSIIGVLGHRN